ncbi:MAG: PTS glucose transporter subunit IIA [Erysipelotrichaceae bacterium]|nr:PTS glucose transporter subunit IIA [Erysipelotrichaceae bacterium]
MDHLEEDLDHLDKNQDLKAFTDGKAVPIEEVPDPVFSKKSMGDGFAIQPDSGKVYSPVSGEVLSVFPGGHAIGIQDSQGREVLIHIGLDTVTLKGEGFTTHIKEGSSVKAGDLIAEFDQDLLKSKDLNDIIICVLTNTSYFKKTELLKTGPVKTGEPVFHTEK